MLAQYGQLLRAVVAGPDPARIPPPSEVIPTLEVEACPIELRAVKGVRTYCGYSVDAAVAGQRSHVILENPTGSGSLATVERVDGQNATSPLLLRMFTIQAGTSAAGPNYFAKDTRYYNRLPGARIVTYTGAIAGYAIDRMWPNLEDAAGNFYYHSDEEFVLFPGYSLMVANSVDNELIWVSFTWRERAYDPEELRAR